MQFDKDLNLISISKDVVEEKHIGFWPITVEGRYEGKNKIEVVSKIFYIRVYQDEVFIPFVEEQEEVFDSGYTVVEELKVPVKENSFSESEQPLIGKPLPYVIELTKTGILKIGWNKVMVPPKDLTILPPA